MKRISAIWTGCAAILAASAPGSLAAAPLVLAPALVVLTQAPAAPDARRQEADDLLRRAREAMAETDWAAADILIRRAEALQIDYPAFYRGDTPALARRDLQRAAEPSPTLGQRLTSLLPGRDSAAPEAPPPDPFAAARAPGPGSAPAPAQPAPASPGVPPSPLLPPGPAGATPVPAASPLSAPPADAARRQSDELLLTARRALSVGDSRRAASLVEQAQTLGINYGLLDDSPAKIEALIRRHDELMQRRAAGPNPEVYNRQYAELLLEQAEALVRWQRFDDAERLANDAARFRVNYSPFDTRPEDLLKRIAAARSGAAGQAPPAGEPRPAPVATGPQPAGSPSPAARQQAVELVARARSALAAGELLKAEALARQAEELRVPDADFGPREDRPAFVLLDVEQARRSGVRTAAGTAPVPAGPPSPYGVNQAIYNPQNDPPRPVVPVQQEELLPRPPGGSPPPGTEPVPPRGTDRVPGPGNSPPPERPGEADAFGPRRAAPGGMLNEFTLQQELLTKKITAEVAQQEIAAKRLQTSDPQQSLRLLEEARVKVQETPIDPLVRGQILRRLEREMSDVRAYIEENRVMIRLDERNNAVRSEMERERQVKVEVQEKLALLVDEFNKLMDEQRYAEAELVAKRAGELAPQEPIVEQLRSQAKFVRRLMNQMDIREAKADGFASAMESIDRAATPFDDNTPYLLPDAKSWEALTSRRKGLAENRPRRTEKELEIERKLRTPVSLQFRQAPLSEVLDYLARLAQVNLHIDRQGLAEEGVTSDTQVTIDLHEDISLKSALNLILEPLHLSYVIKDEVLKITSEHLRDGHLIRHTYNVADLVIPIPNFGPNSRMGMAGALHDAMGSAGSAGMGLAGNFGQPNMAVATAGGNNASQVMVNPAVLAQTPGSMLTPGANLPPPGGPGGMGGGTMADFDSLINLITTTVAPTTWDAMGGPGSIAAFPTNLSLVISQTQEVHDQIEDLLEQLRRLQDLQVTIEVRFITLNDNFFERIGIDFDFDIDDDIDRPFQVFGKDQFGSNSGDATPITSRDLRDRDHGPGVTVGLDPQGNFSADLDIPFQQGSFPLATPQFGNFAPGAGATLGFAILSDLEAFFVIEAAQGDRRSNVLQAPKVTLFNGQQAVVSDTSQSPFVISVIPVVGDFAAAQQPVVVVLSEGTFLTVQAVVSSDRRFVRMTVVPFFSQIGEVNSFTFSGSTTASDSSSNATDGPLNAIIGRRNANEKAQTKSGTTVQLPTFSFVSVVTTVSVPDGGTVLLGGIKRLSEGRSEFGVPLLGKVPYISRLFRNVGIGRETQSLMMMVTPRIIIQEEEEALLLGEEPPAL